MFSGYVGPGLSAAAWGLSHFHHGQPDALEQVAGRAVTGPTFAAVSGAFLSGSLAWRTPVHLCWSGFPICSGMQ
jgi:hypothetical protein